MNREQEKSPREFETLDSIDLEVLGQDLLSQGFRYDRTW
jgi:hypothetical protein